MKLHPAALLIAASLFAACGHSETAEVKPPPEPPRSISPIPTSAHELVVGVVDDWSATKVTLRRYRRSQGWKLVGDPWQGVVGRSGTAWGAGLHGVGAPAGREGPVKREGDGKSPAGVFTIGTSYGYADAAHARRKYVAVDPAWKCVDDPASRHYNTILDQRTTTVDWKSAEEMKRADDLYKWVVELGHNAAHAPNGGSCIFFHVWSGADGATLGCTAMPEAMMTELIATLDDTAVFVLLPRSEYAGLASSWGLPAL